jgi:glutamate formiminotransferase / 5-formyltetrahydrofolate cyclo-ligase
VSGEVSCSPPTAWEAVPNFSEGRDSALVAELGGGPEVIDVHADVDHNRCVVTLAAARLDPLVDTLFRRVALAVERIDLRRHAGLHPRVGAADVAPLVPLGGAPMADAVAAAHRLGRRIWAELGVPVHFYAEAGEGRRLADVRAGRCPPDLGDAPHPTAGAACVGARRPLVAYNVVFTGLDDAAGRRLAAAMRGLDGVQALAFALPGGGTQVSMNLTRPEAAGAALVYRQACQLARERGRPELVGLCPAVATGPGCDGRVLEARLAAMAAAGAADDARRRGGDELSRLAGRLAAEAASLRALAASQEALLGGAERAAALVRVLRAAGLATPDREELLGAAAGGLRAAIDEAAATRFVRRIALLDLWLRGA